MSDPRFARIVSLACHDLRTPLATVTGFARTLERAGTLEEREARYVEMIVAAAGQIALLLDELGVLARVESGRYDPVRVEADTLDLATSGDERIETSGAGATIETDEPAMRRALEAVAIAAARHGMVDSVAWTVRERELELSPVASDAAAVVLGEEVRDLGAIAARAVLEALGAGVELAGETLRVTL